MRHGREFSWRHARVFRGFPVEMGFAAGRHADRRTRLLIAVQILVRSELRRIRRRRKYVDHTGMFSQPFFHRLGVVIPRRARLEKEVTKGKIDLSSRVHGVLEEVATHLARGVIAAISPRGVVGDQWGVPLGRKAARAVIAQSAAPNSACSRFTRASSARRNALFRGAPLRLLRCRAPALQFRS